MLQLVMMDPSQLVGTWHVVRRPSEEYSQKNHSIYRMTEDFRWMHFAEFPEEHRRPSMIPDESGTPCLIAVRMWYEIEGEGIFRLRPTRMHEGWLRRFSMKGDDLVLETVEEAEPKRWVSERLTDEKVPLWFENACAQTLSRPWK